MGMIWTRAPHQQFLITVGGPDLSQQFGVPWEAFGLVVANHSNQHLWIPDVNWYVPPGVVGATVPIPGLSQATAKFAPPPQRTDPPAIAGQLAILDYYADELMPYPGVPTSITTQQSQLLLDSFRVNTSSSTSKNYVLPNGTHALAVLLSAAANVTQLTISGFNSGINYVSSATPKNITVASLVTAIDATASVVVTVGNIGFTNVWIAAVVDPQSFYVFSGP